MHGGTASLVSAYVRGRVSRTASSGNGLGSGPRTSSGEVVPYMPVNLSDYATTFVAVSVAWLVMVPSCRCNDTEGPSPAPDASTSATVVPVPSTAPTTSSEPPKPSWEPVLKLGAVAGWWGQGEGEEAPLGPWATLDSRKVAKVTNKPWKLPYPWHLRVKTDARDQPTDCGLFEKINDDGRVIGWRVGYCMGGAFPKGKRTATRIFFHTKKKEAGNGLLLRVRIGDEATDLSRDLP